MSDRPDIKTLQDYLTFAEAVLREAGKIARQHYSFEIELTTKVDNSPVTAADEAINSLIIQRMRQQFPGVGVLGEEESAEGEPTNKLLVVCDPIDGTIPYMLHIPISTCCIAFVQDGVPVVGAVYDFHNDRLYSAVKGQGAFLNGKRLQATPQAQMKLVCVEKWPTAPHNVSKLQQRLDKAGYQSPNYASFGYTSMLIALGKISGGVYAGDKPWDVAAAKVIVEELGVKVTALDGHDQRYDGPIRGAIVAYPEVHNFLVAP